MKRFLILVATAAACSGASSSSNSSSGPATAEQACADYAARYCDFAERCAPSDLNLTHGDAASCRDAFKVACPTWVSAKGSIDTPARIDACSNALSTATCDLYFFYPQGWPETCPSKGSLAAGAGCVLDTQCESGYCPYTVAECSTCKTRSAAGGPCQLSDDCDFDSTCVNGTCALKTGLGTSCAADSNCASGLACTGFNGPSGAGTCSKLLGAGAACDPSNPGLGECDYTAGLSCDATNKCSAAAIPPLARTGEDCSFGCDGKNYCDAQNTCRLKLAAGSSCTRRDMCAWPARCLSGVCQVPDPSHCP
jgi:hypothetical protein